MRQRVSFSTDGRVWLCKVCFCRRIVRTPVPCHEEPWPWVLMRIEKVWSKARTVCFGQEGMGGQARCDGVDPDAMLSHVQRRAPGQGHDPGLRGRIVRLTRLRAPAEH